MDLNDQTRAAAAELLSKLENARFSAMLGCNLSALQRLLADDLIYIHSTGVVINGCVRGGRNVYLEHQVTIGAERRSSPVLGDDVFIGAGAKVIGAVKVGDGARIGANAVVVDDVPPHSTVVGIPARVVRQREA